jgi:hypothetical protein
MTWNPALHLLAPLSAGGNARSGFRLLLLQFRDRCSICGPAALASRSLVRDRPIAPRPTSLNRSVRVWHHKFIG